jgi:hypothetical protein
VGAGLAVPQNREREREERLGRRGKELTSGPRLSVRERGKGEKGRLGRGPGREGKGAGEELGRKAEPREKRGKGKFLFFSKTIFQTHFSNEMEFKTLYKIPHII